MTDYLKATGSSGTMMIRDTGSTVEFWLNAGNSTTWSDHIPWFWAVNGGSGSGSYYYHPNSGWNKIAAFTVTTSQSVGFALGNTGTSGFGGPTDFSIPINRSTVPPAPNPVVLSSVTSTSIHAVFSGNGEGGSPVDFWQIGWGTDPNTPQSTINLFDTIISGLTPGTTYYFWARGHNANGFGPWSARTQATTLRVPDAPSVPAISSIGPTSVVASFTANGDGGSPILEFAVSYGTDPDDLSSTNYGSSPQTITGLQPGTTYYFASSARNSIGWGLKSANSSAMTIAGARIKVGADWKIAVPYVRVSGVWKLATPWVKDAGVWKETI